MLVHTVFFWLRDNLSNEERAAFLDGVKTLQEIPDAATTHVGTPAATEPRPVIDRSYDVGLTVICEDIPSHDRYQEHPIHLAFIEQCSQYWDRVVVYDAEDA